MKMIFKNQRLNFKLVISVVIFLPLAITFAMDVEMRNLPMPANAKVIWEDKSAQVNNIPIRASRLTCYLGKDEIINFYKDALAKDGWKLADEYPEQGVFGFTKEQDFLYLGVVPEGDTSDIYLVKSPQDLHLCRTLVDYFFSKEGVAPDAEGKDLADIPRYPGSRRRLNIFTEKEGAFLLYETDASVQQVGEFYREALKQMGWKLMPAFQLGFLSSFSETKEILNNVALLCFEKNNETLFIFAYPMPRQVSKAHTLISITRNLLDELYPQIEEPQEGQVK